MDSTTLTHHPDCADCLADLEHCHEASIEHADGFTECLDVACTLAHNLHGWQLPCSVFDPPCGCVPEELEAGAVAVAGGGLAVAA